MTLDEAIKILEHQVSYRDCFDSTEKYHAIKLGIEALKFRQRWEQQEGEDDFPLLPGETEE